MSALLPLYFETTTDRLVRGLGDPAPITLRHFYQEDSLLLDISIVQIIPEAIEPPFCLRIPTTAYSLTVSVGLAGNPMAAQTEWTQTADKFSGALPLNTAALNALADHTEVILEIRLFDGTHYHRGHFRTLFRKSVQVGSVLPPPPEEIALGNVTADAIYARKIRRAGEHDIYTSKLGLWRRIVGVDDEGNPVDYSEQVQ